jgi:proteasome lid subunit RPN8/RPN11
MPRSSVLSSRENLATSDQCVGLSAALLDRFRRRATAVHGAGLKSYGLLVAEPGSSGFPYCATDVVFFDSTNNRRNDPWVRSAFEAQGAYFRAYDDAGFVADPAEVLRVHREIEEAGLEPVAMFHSHRRQPANFSHIDFRLHNPAYPWHLIISFRDAHRPMLRAFAVRKDLDAFGIDPGDGNENSECAYSGPEVRQLPIVSDVEVES